jgi:putative DNA primase/helicase
MNHDPVQRVLARLDSIGRPARREGAGWVACCPAHDDARPSLAIGRGRNGDALVFCRSAGCGVRRIADALGMAMLELKAGTAPAQASADTVQHTAAAGAKGSGFPDAKAAARWLRARRGAWTRIHTYADSAGESLGIVVRWDFTDAAGRPRKHFVPVWRFGARWRIGCAHSDRPLYALPELGTAGRVFIVEGEKCADILRGIGVRATTSGFGARSAAKSCWLPLAGREACLLPDADIGGLGYAQEVKALLEALRPPARVRIVRLPGLREGSKDDAEQWIEDRHHGDAESAAAELERLADAAFAQEGGAE